MLRIKLLPPRIFGRMMPSEKVNFIGHLLPASRLPSKNASAAICTEDPQGIAPNPEYAGGSFYRLYEWLLFKNQALR